MGGGLSKGLYCILGFVEFEKKGTSIEQIVYQLSGQRGRMVMQCTMLNLIRYFFLLMPGILFGIMLGKKLYQSFCIGSIYVFSRNANRKKWYINQLGIIIMESFLFEVSAVITVVGTERIFCPIAISTRGIHLLVIFLLMNLLFEVIIAGFFNAVAIEKGSRDAFTMAITLIATGIASLLLLKNGSENVYYPIRIAIYFNPFSHMIMGWKNPVAERVPIITCEEESMVYFLVLFIITIMINAGIVRYKQILDNNTEEQTL